MSITGYGLNCVVLLPEHVEVILTSAPQNETILEIRKLQVLSVKITSSYRRWSLIQCDHVLIQHCYEDTESAAMQLASQKTVTATSQQKQRTCFCTFQKEHSPVGLQPETPASRFRQNKFLLFYTPSLWYFVTSALGN